MDYNHYYSPQAAGHPSPPVASSQHGGGAHQQQQPPPQPSSAPGGQLLHTPTMQTIRQSQAMQPGHPSHQQQHLGHHSQQMTPQQHPSYHQQHGPLPPVPHSGSPHSGSTHSGSPHSGSPHPQQQQHHHHSHLISAGPQHHIHSQSPHQHHHSGGGGGPTLHMQQFNQIIRPPMGPSMMSHPQHQQQPGLQQQQQLVLMQNHHHQQQAPPQHQQQQHLQQQNFFNSSATSNSLPTPSPSLHHYASHQNQHPLSHHHQTQSHLHHHQSNHQQNQQAVVVMHHASPQPQPQPLPPPQLAPPPAPQQHQHLHQNQHQTHQLNHHQQPQQQPQQQLPLGIERNTSFHPNMSQTEFRIVELNRRLQCRPNNLYEEAIWWERLAVDFFEENASLTIYVQDDKPVDYTIGRALIPRFFRTYFDGGVTDLSINLRNPKEVCIHPQLITLECDQTLIVTNNIFRHPSLPANQSAIVHTEGRLLIEFVSNNSYDTPLTIKSWKFYTRGCREYIDRSLTGLGLPKSYLVEPITKQGLTKSTISYLKMCMIMRSMQDLMAQHKQTKTAPRTCLKQFLYDRYKFTSDDSRAAANKRRKRRSAASPSTTANGTAKKKTKASSMNINSASNGIINDNLLISPVATQSFSLASQDVMVVGEPSIMGSDFSDNNERMITSRIENDNCPSNQPQPPSAPPNYQSSNIVNSETTDSSSPSSNGAQSTRQQQVTPPNTHNESVQVNQSTSPNAVEQQQQEDLLTNSDLEKKPDNSPICKLAENNYVQSDSTSEISVPLEPKEQAVKVTEKKEQVVENNKDDTNLEETNEEKTKSSESVAIQSETSNMDQTELKDEPKEELVSPKQISEESLEKENNNSVFIEDTHLMNSTAIQNENHFSIMNSIPENREDTCRSTSCDSIVSKLPPNSNNKNTLTSNGANNKQNRRRSSERKETLREGLMRTTDFVVARNDLKCEHPSLWRITTGNNLLQHFEAKIQNGVVVYENTDQYAGWNQDIKKEYVGVDVKLTQHTRNQITVERLLLNFQKLEDADTFYDWHFSIYLQILISTVLDPKFWEGLEKEQKHHDHFSTSRRIIEDITKRYKIKLSSKLKLNEASLKNVEKYPNLLIKPIARKEEKEQQCRACNATTSTQMVSFGNRSYDLHSYKSVKVTSELSKTNEEKDSNISLCDHCLEIVKLYSEIHHMGWKFYNIAREKVELHRTKGKPIHLIVKECTEDKEWLLSMYDERDALWSKVENLH